MTPFDELIQEIDDAANRETGKRLNSLIRRLPQKFTWGEKARLRVLTNAIYVRGAGLEESLEMARKQVREKPMQSMIEDLRSRFWEDPYPSKANAKVLEMLRQRVGE